jgi:serine/threonine protein kinase
MDIKYEDIKSQLIQDNIVGTGGYGAVYKIVINKINYAVKQIYLKNNNTDLTDNQILVMENEAKNLIKINHKNIVKYYNLYKTKDSLFILMEYCHNLDLHQFIKFKKKNNSSIDNFVIFLIVLDICEGLKEIHKNNLIHRDLKPENIFISKDYTFKIGDFDFAKRLNGSKNVKATSKPGTINYMATEMINSENFNNKYSNKIDI